MTTKKKTPVEDEAADEVTPEPEKKNSDIESILPDPEFFTMSDGTEVRINRLKTRETLKLLKILTRGGGSMLTTIDWSASMSDAEEFGGKLIALVVYSIPQAEDETLEFIQAMVSPLNLIERPRSKADQQHNSTQWEELSYQLANPEIEDTVGIVSSIVRREASDIQALGKRLRLLMPAARSL